MYIRSPEGLGRGSRLIATSYGWDARAGLGLGQQVAQPFGPAAAQHGLPFRLTDEQIKVVLGALRHAPGEETFFYIHADSTGRDRPYEFGVARPAPPGVQHQIDFRWGDAMDEADQLTRKARRAAAGGTSVVTYAPAGFGHTHPVAHAGKPSGTDLGHLASIPTASPLVALVTGTALMPRPGAVGKSTTRNATDPRRELDASVVWRSGYAPAPGTGGKLLTPQITMPGPVTYASHQAASAAAHGISPDLVMRYFQGKIVYERGQFSSEFVEVP